MGPLEKNEFMDDIQGYAKEAKLPILNDDGMIKPGLYPPLDLLLRKVSKQLGMFLSR